MLAAINFNPLPVLAAAAANYVLGAVWYTVFGKTWMRLLNKSKEELKPGPMPYVIAFVGSLFTAATLAWLIQITGHGDWESGLLIGLITWMGLAAANAAKHYAFTGAKPQLFAIDYGYDLIGFLVMASILTIWL